MIDYINIEKEIQELDIIDNKYIFLEKDDNNREILIFNLKNSKLIGNNINYPNCLIFNDNKVYNPIREKIMSLDKIKNDNKINFIHEPHKIIFKTPVFYFIYNLDNYYHFVYDTLPYLLSYFELKKKIKDLKLLMNFSSDKKDFYPFVKEFLSILSIKDNDIIIANKHTLYEDMYISSSYTHDNKSNIPPRKEIYFLYQKIVSIVNNIILDKELPKKIYISRRSWIHNDYSNIGTNYTLRRKLKNEDLLVNFLNKKGIVEVFTEKLSTIEKILMFSKAELVIGAIGGGLCNVLFSNSDCKLIPIISPTFLDINNRFIFSFFNVKTDYFYDTEHVEKDFWKKYMRIKDTENNIIGEIEDVLDNDLIISYSNEKVSGWNSETTFNKIKIKKSNCVPLDNGLNSSWIINLEEFIKKFS